MAWQAYAKVGSKAKEASQESSPAHLAKLEPAQLPACVLSCDACLYSYITTFGHLRQGQEGAPRDQDRFCLCCCVRPDLAAVGR